MSDMILNVDELLYKLSKWGQNHNSYYHYTNWDSFSKIYNGRSFLLTRGNSMFINDQHEAKMKGTWEEWEKTYLGSFSFDKSENMAMWGLYGLPCEDAVRIEIPQKAMLHWLEEINHAYEWSDNQRGQKIPLQIVLSDIVYVYGKRGSNALQLHRDGKKLTVANTFDLTGLDINPRMTGFIKNRAWQYENEVRLIAKIRRARGAEKLMIDIPEEVLDAMKITCGPSFYPYINDPLYIELKNKGRIEPSGFEGLVKYRTLCSMCQKAPFLAME